MTNEMGNQNTSGIKEEEKAAVEVPEGAQVADFEDEATEEGNNITSEDQTEGSNENAEDLPSPDIPSARDSRAEIQESDEKEPVGKESESDKLPEAPLESNNPVILESDKLQIHDHPIGGAIEVQAETNSSFSEAKSVRDSNPTDDSNASLEERPNLSLQNGEVAEKLSGTYSTNDKEKRVDYKSTNGNVVDLKLEDSVFQEEKPSDQIEKCEKNEIVLKNGHLGKNGDVEMPLKVNLHDSTVSQTETVQGIGPQDLSSAYPEPQEKHIIQAKEVKAMPVESEDGQNKPDSDHVHQPSDLTVNQLDEATASTMNGDGNTPSMSSGSDWEKALPTDGSKAISNDTGGISVDKENVSGHEQYSNTEETVVLPELVSMSSNESGASDKYEEEATEKYFAGETEKRTQEPSSTKKTTRKRRTSQSFQSFGGENELVAGYHTSQMNSQNGQEAVYLAPSFNSLSGNQLLTGSLPAEHEHKITVSLKQDISHEVLINEISTCNVQNACLDTPNHCRSVQVTTVEESTLLITSKAQENTARLSIDSNPDHQNQRVQIIRRSPSFEFGLPLDARSEESDQTPLLVRDKSLARSFSGSAGVKFQKTILPSDQQRKSLDYEPIQVEEKTIRMERSTSDVSRDSFMKFLKKDGRASTEQASEKQDSNAADQNQLESPSRELPLTSVKTNGRRRPRSSLLSACICCSAVIH